jgi:hypothetical protein
MSRVAFVVPAAALAMGLVAGISSADARLLGQAGAVDPSTYNTADPMNGTRPTLVLPRREPQSATNPPRITASRGWSALNGPYTSARGRPLTVPELPGDVAPSTVARR